MATSHDPAVVRPRVRSSLWGNGEPVLLEDLLAWMLERNVRGVLRLAGPPGSGRRTAIRSMRARFVRAAKRVKFVEGQPPVPAEDDPRLHVGIASLATIGVSRDTLLEMQPWSRDECIEYLLAAHPTQVASILSRLAAACHVIDPRGHAGTVRATLEAFARDTTVFGVDDVIERHIAEDDHEAERWPPVVIYRCARDLTRSLIDGGRCEDLLDLESPDEFHAASMLVRRNPAALRTMRDLLDHDDVGLAARARFFVNRVDVKAIGEWLESRLAAKGALPSLAKHSLAGVDWSGRALASLDACGARLSQALLAGVDLKKAQLDGVDLSDACLREACLDQASMRGANLRGADLTRAYSLSGRWRDADLGGATLDESHLCWSTLVNVRFDGASLDGADLSRANLTGASFAGAKLHDVVFEGAVLTAVDFTCADLRGRRFGAASMAQSNLQGARLPDADFSHTDLGGALLTSSWMPGAKFHKARLTSAGLADVRWPCVDLSRANLRGASFHFGSSRSGLVFHGPPMEGSRTGFYTEDFLDLMHQPPELVRKADLQRANLTDADVFETDFYLVDLRGARYDEEQRRHFRTCGAILDDWPGPR